MNKELIAILVPSMCGGGAERAMLNLAIGLQERGLNVDVVLGKAKGPYLGNIPSEIRIIDLKASRILTSLRGLMMYLKKEQPASLISVMPHTNVVAILARYLARTNTKIIAVIQDAIFSGLPNTMGLKFRVVRLLTKLLYPKANSIVTVSNGVAEDVFRLGGIAKSKVKVIFNPMITPELKDKAKAEVGHKWFVAKDRPVLVSAGRLTAQKDFKTLLRAFKIVLERRKAYLMILGQGEERDSLKKLISELGLDKEVDMPGFVDNPYAYIAKADVFILSSAWEGLPGVLIEALALGTPVVSTNCFFGPQEILKEGRLGRLVPVGDWKMLANAVVATLEEPLMPVSLEDLKPFTKEKVVDEYLELLKE